MKISKLHEWNLSYSQARELQTRLAGQVQLAPLKQTPKLIAGLDCAFSKDGKRIAAAAVVLRMPDAQKGLWEPLAATGFETFETTSAVQEVNFVATGTSVIVEAPKERMPSIEKLITDLDSAESANENRTYKIDGVLIPDKQADVNLRAMFERVMAATGGKAVFNLDVTAGRRWGYHYGNEYGNIFLENRYTDWGNYYPHWTLRNL